MEQRRMVRTAEGPMPANVAALCPHDGHRGPPELWAQYCLAVDKWRKEASEAPGGRGIRREAMPEAMRIVNWVLDYEVTKKGHAASAATPIEELRAGPLEFVRYQVYGPRDSAGVKRLRTAAKTQQRYLEARGVFAELLEFAAANAPLYRGWIVDSRGEPYTVESFARMAGLPLRAVTRSIEILASPTAAWITWAPFDPGASPVVPDLPGIPGDAGESGTLHETQTQTQGENQKKPKPNPNPDPEGEAGGNSGISALTVRDLAEEAAVALHIASRLSCDAAGRKMTEQEAKTFCTLQTAAEHAIEGRLGEDGVRFYRKHAARIGRDPKVNNRAGTFIGRVKVQLEEHGRKWRDY